MGAEGIELFFGSSEDENNARKEKGRWARVKRAKSICQTCPVETECLVWSMVWLPHGIAGGMTARERQKLRGLLEEEGF